MTPDQLKLASEGVAAAKGYVDLFVKPPLEELGLFMKETIGSFRVKNQIKVLSRTRQICIEQGIDPKKMLPDVFVPLIEEAGNTSDPDLSEMFANLLTSHLTDNSNAHPTFAKVLGQVSPLDAKLFHVIDEKEKAYVEIIKDQPGVFENPLQWTRPFIYSVFKEHNTGVEDGELALSLLNLQRLGFWKDDGFTFKETAIARGEAVRITEFGARFLSACSSPAYWRNDFKSKGWAVQHAEEGYAFNEELVAMVKNEIERAAPKVINF
jgi:Abortive infection alpha